MRYIDAYKLIAEIEFAKSVYDNPKRVIHGVADAFRQDGRAAMCDDILKKIASLQQEQPEIELGKEITPSLVENMLCEFGVQSIEDVDSECLADIARHFYELGLNAKKEQPEGGCSEKPNNLNGKEDTK